jgi:dUTP pyrophosphatase
MIHDVIDRTLRGVESVANQMRKVNRAAEALGESREKHETSERIRNTVNDNWRRIKRLEETVESALEWEPPTVKVSTTDNYEDDWGAPQYQTDGAAAFDLRACFRGAELLHEFAIERQIEDREDSFIDSPLGFGPIRKIPTGLRFDIPKGYHGRVSLRSSSADEGLFIPNGIGVIDSDYRGQVYILLASAFPQKVDIQHGERIAQISIVPSPQCNIEMVDELGETARGDGGFGSTGEK